MSESATFTPPTPNELKFMTVHFRRFRGLASMLHRNANEMRGDRKPYTRDDVWREIKTIKEEYDPLVIEEARRLLEVNMGVRYDQPQEA